MLPCEYVCKKVRQYNDKTNKVYEYIHLVENLLTKKGQCQCLSLNLCNRDLYYTQYKVFVKKVEDILMGQWSFIELDTILEKQARAATSGSMIVFVFLVMNVVEKLLKEVFYAFYVSRFYRVFTVIRGPLHTQ
jgi:hypothetical protein